MVRAVYQTISVSLGGGKTIAGRTPHLGAGPPVCRRLRDRDCISLPTVSRKGYAHIHQSLIDMPSEHRPYQLNVPPICRRGSPIGTSSEDMAFHQRGMGTATLSVLCICHTCMDLAWSYLTLQFSSDVNEYAAECFVPSAQAAPK